MIKINKFRGGVHPASKKETSGFRIERLPEPEKIYLHLAGSIGAPAVPVVAKGDRVLKAQTVAEPAGRISACIHSPVSGTVAGIADWPHFSGKKLPAVIIENDSKGEEKPKKPLKNVLQMSPSDITSIIRKSGIVGLGGAAFPTDVKLSALPGKKITTLVVNGCECEPYLTADESLIAEKPSDIIEGAKIAARALSAKDIIIGIEKNKKRSARRLLEFQDSRIKVVFLPVRYPQGGEKQLVWAVTGRKITPGGLPADAGCAVINVQTARAIYEALYLGKVLYERVMTLTGMFRKPGNFIIPAGTRLEDIINFRGGLPEDVDKIIMGGPMMGPAVSSLDVPVTKATSGIILSKSVSPARYECIRCMRCSDVCPMNLTPRKAYSLYGYGKAYTGAADCIECGSCAYTCPAGIDLVHYLKWAKAKLASSAAKK